jgi:hypothetical protein
MPTFHIRQGERAGETITLKMTHIIIGSSPECPVRLPDASIESAHASLENRGERWILQDLGSPGGTWLNDEPVTMPRRILDGDVIKTGDIRLEVRGIGPAADRLSDMIAITSLAELEPDIHPAPASRRRVAMLGVAGLILVVVLFLVFRGLGVGTAGGSNDPPNLTVLLEDDELIVLPHDLIIFESEAEDKEDLERVEFWVNDKLVQVKRPASPYVVKLRAIHHWSAAEPGRYTLSVIAYDRAGQPSHMVKVPVTVQIP